MRSEILLLVALLVAGAATAQLPGAETVLTLEPGPGNPRNSEGDFVQLKDGRILFAYTHFTGSDGDEGTAHIAGRFSADGGKTWSDEDTLILPNEGKQNTMSVSLLRLNTGEIALFYLRKDSDYDCRPYMRVSTDEAASWSEPTLCIDATGYFVVNNDRVIQLSTGRLVIPAARHSMPGEEFRRRGEALCYLSDDNGKTWRQGKTILQAPEASKSGLQEPGVIELKDANAPARLMMLSRTDQGSQFVSYSADGGDTWSHAEPSQLISPVSPATFERIPENGKILLVWNNHANIAPDLNGKRTPLSIALSADEAASWTAPVNIETNPDGWYCYTALEFLPGHALLAYCAGDKTVGGLNRLKIVRLDLQ
jgi:Neuraminidase (sialidase)